MKNSSVSLSFETHNLIKCFALLLIAESLNNQDRIGAEILYTIARNAALYTGDGQVVTTSCDINHFAVWIFIDKKVKALHALNFPH